MDSTVNSSIPLDLRSPPIEDQEKIYILLLKEIDNGSRLLKQRQLQRQRNFEQ